MFVRLGLGPPLLSAVRPSATETMTKSKSVKFLLWDEKSIRQSKKRNKGSSIQQLERIYLIQGEDRPLIYKKRRHFEGTSHGDCIGPVPAPSWEETWIQCPKINITKHFSSNWKTIWIHHHGWSLKNLTKHFCQINKP